MAAHLPTPANDVALQRTEPPRPPSAAVELARAAAAGDVAATRRLLEAVAPRMARVVHAVLGARHPDADDVVQQSLIALVQALPSFRGECEPVQYGSRIAVRTAVAARKRARRLESRRDDGVDADQLTCTRLLPSDRLRAARRRTMIRELLEDIPDEQAESMALRFVLGWSLDEVARATGAPVNTVRSRLRIAKQALKKRIEANPAFADELGLEEDA